MPRKFCCNPLGLHKQQVTKVRRVTASAVSTGLVNEGDLICCKCRLKLSEKLKPKNPTEGEKTEENPPEASLLAAPQPTNGESASNIQTSGEVVMDIQPANEQDAANVQPPNVDAVPDTRPPTGEAPLSESEESTEDESVLENPMFEESLDECEALSVSNSGLLAFGESPVKRRGLTLQTKRNKIKRKVKSVKVTFPDVWMFEALSPYFG